MINDFDLEKIYRRMPIGLQNVFVCAEGWRIRRRRYNRQFRETLSTITNRLSIRDEQLREYWQERLRTFIAKAEKSRYWAERFRQYGVEVRGADPLSELAKLPILTKQEVKANIADITVAGISDTDVITSRTSGTTGSGLVFSVKKSAERLQWATWWRYRRWHHITMDMWCGYFGGRSVVPIEQQRRPFWRINYPGRQVLFSAYHLNEDTASDYVNEIIARGIPWLHGYPSTLSLLAKFKLDHGLANTPNLKIITTGAENLLPHQKALIEKAFGVPVRQHYGQAEGVANISECELGRLHVDEDFSFLEFLPVAGADNLFRIIGTNFANEAFPLLRYDTGDIAVLDRTGCSCGKPGRIVEHIDGRSDDFVTLPNGARVARLGHIFKDMTRIREAQIIQLKDYSVRLRVVPGQDFDFVLDERRLLQNARVRLGKELPIRIEYVKRLPRTPLGKLRFVVSELPGARILDE